MFKSLRRRLIFLCTLATGIIVAAMACAFLTYSLKLLTQSEADSFQANANAILYHVRSQTVLDHTWLSQMEASGGFYLHLELTGRPLLYSSAVEDARRAGLFQLAREIAFQDYQFNLSRAPESILQTEQVEFLFEDGGEGFRAVAAAIPLNQGWAGVLIVKPLAPLAAEQSRLVWVFGGISLAALGLLALFAWAFTGWALRPIEENRKRQTQFVAAASHELRSPLAVIHSSLSALRGAAPEQAARFTELADGECMRMSRLVGDMLALANADNGAWSVRWEEAELDTLVLTVCEGFEGHAREKGVRLTPVLPEEPLPPCRCDQGRMAQVLSVLIDNGLCYTPSGGAVTVETNHGPEGFTLRVSDTGPGIPPEDRGRIFERFYRGDPSRTSREHYGLGLSIAWEIVELHHGAIRVDASAGNGARFIVTLPDAAAPLPR